RIDVEAPGFKKFSRQGILVEVDRTLGVDIHLDVGALSEQVVVSSAPPVLETESGQTNSVLDGSIFVKVPLGDRIDQRVHAWRIPFSNFGDSNRLMIGGARSAG